MIVRIVKMTFQEDKLTSFLAFFDTIKQKVNNFDSCHGMQLMQDKAQPNIVFTYSLWENEEALEVYRKSETFGNVWSTIKPWFAAKTEAWTLEKYFNGFENKNV